MLFCPLLRTCGKKETLQSFQNAILPSLETINRNFASISVLASDLQLLLNQTFVTWLKPSPHL